MRSYKGIVFAVGYDKPFADFKKEFGSTHIFKNIPSAQREAELKKAYKIATATEGPSAKPKPSEPEESK